MSEWLIEIENLAIADSDIDEDPNDCDVRGDRIITKLVLMLKMMTLSKETTGIVVFRNNSHSFFVFYVQLITCYETKTIYWQNNKHQFLVVIIAFSRLTLLLCKSFCLRNSFILSFQ